MLAWGLETIKNIQTHVGLAAADDGANEDRVEAPHPSNGAVDLFHREADVHINTESFSPPPGSTVAEWGEAHIGLAEQPGKGERNVGLVVEDVKKHDEMSKIMTVLKAEREDLTKTRKTNQANITKLGKDLVAARAHGHENDSAYVKALKARLYDLRLSAQRQEQRWTYLEDTIVEPKGYIHLKTEFKESFRFRTPSDKGSSRGRLRSTEDDRALSSESSSPTRAAKSPLATRLSSSPTRATRVANPPLAARQEGSFRGRMKTSPADDDVIFTGRSLSAEGPGLSARPLSSESSSQSPTRAAKSPLATRQEGSLRGRMTTWSTGDGIVQ
ncbi:hypothetical protein T484DRAFT_1976131 [Baffinella frigidus]|nr:hypothetical protein T484DRAFT_1976131 [Cryptophyta sp. CCMP2293]